MLEWNTIRHSLQSFPQMANLMENHTPDEIIRCVAEATGKDVNKVASMPMGGYSKGMKSGAYYFVLQDLKNNLGHYRWLYNRLADYTSRNVFENLIRFRIFPDISFVKNAFDSESPQYFDLNIMNVDENEVFVDCGGFTGDTVESYMSHCKQYKKIYVYEPSSENHSQCVENLKPYKNVIVKQMGVGKSASKQFISNMADASSFAPGAQGIEASARSTDQIQIVSLDEDIAEPITFIKMDIECFEIDALLGAKRHIREDMPKLAICVYHIVSDIWEIPRLIHAINPNYTFYIRHYNENQNWETVIYAIPENRQERQLQKAEEIGVYALSPFIRMWVNEQLLKDCGLSPYMLHKTYGFKATMVGENTGEYPYLQEYLKGMNMDFVPDSEDATMYASRLIDYLDQNYEKMDIIVLNGAYLSYYPVLKHYRKLRPDGKIYMALDANSGWMDRIDWKDPLFREMLDYCDVLGTSCRKMQHHLNRKWPWIIEYIPNGFYNATKAEIVCTPECKENIILTVGRIGTAQKANHILLEAFAGVYENLPGWNVLLVGSIDESFVPYIEDYFSRYPQLKDRVIFKGHIQSKQELFAEYSKAKIFILTSVFEGAPNVAAEALSHGCYMITSEIDASIDITNYDACGRSFPINDTKALKKVLLEVCQNPDLLKESIKNSTEFAHQNYDWELIIQRVGHLLMKG